jgi:tripartite-type tricarboxylate transporter receptor subunit TctC
MGGKVKIRESQSRLNKLLGVMLIATVAAASHAQDFPVRPIRLIVGSSAGGGGDGVARVVAAKLSPLLGQQVVVDNRPGAAGNIGTEMVARAAPDGYTLLFVYTGHVINPALFKKLPFDPLRDFSPVGRIGYNNSALVVNPALPVHTVKELIAFAKARPGKLTAGAIPGGSQHLATEMLKIQAGVDILYVPYKGNGPANTDLLSGQLDLMFNTLQLVAPLAKAGRLRALAVASEKRSELMPELPTISESALKGFSAQGWYGLVAPAGTPRNVIEKLNAALNAALRDADTQQRFRAMGNEIASSTADQFDALIRAEIPKWAEVARRAGIKPE